MSSVSAWVRCYVMVEKRPPVRLYNPLTGSQTGWSSEEPACESWLSTALAGERVSRQNGSLQAAQGSGLALCLTSNSAAERVSHWNLNKLSATFHRYGFKKVTSPPNINIFIGLKALKEVSSCYAEDPGHCRPAKPNDFGFMHRWAAFIGTNGVPRPTDPFCRYLSLTQSLE